MSKSQNKDISNCTSHGAPQGGFPARSATSAKCTVKREGDDTSTLAGDSYMTSLLARVGALEARLASQIIWKTGKRKRGDWVCTECRRRRGLKQRRAYSDDTFRAPAGRFSPFPLHNEYGENQEPARSAWGLERPAAAPTAWGLDSEQSDPQDVEQGTTKCPGAWGLELGESQLQDPEAHDNQFFELWEQVEQQEQAEETDLDTASDTLASAVDVPDESVHEEAILNIDYAAELTPALLQGASDTVARCLLAAARKNDTDFVQSIPATSFSECISLLQPSNFTTKLANAHLEISDAVAKVFRISPIDRIAGQHGFLLREIKAIRTAAGIRCSLADYRMLLASARDLGSKFVAENLWMSLLHDGLTPDTACYNSYMAAIVFDQVHSPISRQTVRVIPFYKLARQRKRLGPAFTTYRVGNGGLKDKIMQFFGDMLRTGAIANEESFRTVITALAREGDIATVKSILRRMWNIDVDGIMGAKPEENMEPKVMSHNNPLRLTEDFLFTIAHAFCINNDIPTALRVVDFIARRYDLTIPTKTWDQLFEWTFVLAIPRTGIKARTDGTREGQLPQQSVLNLWNTMTGAPYLIRPTMGMYNNLIKNLQYRDLTPLMYEKMQEGVALHYKERRKARLAFERLTREIDKIQSFPSYVPAVPLENLRREYEYLDLIRKRDHFFVRRWVRLLLSTIKTRIHIDDGGDWPLRNIPRILWEWRHFAGTQGNNIRYEVPGGQVEFRIRDEAEVEENKAVRQMRAERIRKVLDQVPVLLGEAWVFQKAEDKQQQFAWQARA